MGLPGLWEGSDHFWIDDPAGDPACELCHPNDYCVCNRCGGSWTLVEVIILIAYFIESARVILDHGTFNKIYEDAKRRKEAALKNME
jgi:hypothetical protein